MAIKWNKRALWYKEKIDFPFTLLMRSAVPFLQKLSPTKICQVACGTGSSLETLRSLFPKTPIYASDLEQEMLNFAEQRKVSNCFLRVANNQNLPYSENQFDLLIAGLSLNLVPNPQKMLSQAFRVLKPGGTAYFSVMGNRKVATHSQVMCKIFQQQAPDYDHNLRFYFGSKERAIESLESHGFKDILTYSLKVPMPYVDTAGMLETIENYYSYENLNAEQKESVRKFIDSVVVRNEPFYFDSRIILGKK